MTGANGHGTKAGATYCSTHQIMEPVEENSGDSEQGGEERDDNVGSSERDWSSEHRESQKERSGDNGERSPEESVGNNGGNLGISSVREGV